jgi:asparagine synthase (glutamine-hydrolysing)
MCGIVGMLDLTGHSRADGSIVRAMAAAIHHRGPDGDGFYESGSGDLAMGMRRLSIIDVIGSDQPLFNEDGRIALVFNGEIYNYRELRASLIAQGHQFRTEGDGETLIHLYEQEGMAMFGALRGMYGFALWDEARSRLVLAVDHIGMKPLYVHESGGVLRFASEVKALLVDPAVRAEIDETLLDHYMTFGYRVGAETLFKGIRRIPPGHALIAEGGRLDSVQNWRFGQSPVDTAGMDETAIIAGTRERIAESVRLHLRSDVPLGLFLSGGVDSAAVLANMAAQGGQIETFTVGYAMATGDNELAAARRIAAHFGTAHHERVIDAEDWWRGFERYIYHHDEPNANPSAVSLLLLAEETAKRVKVVLTGLGGDELFCGYGHHRIIPWALTRRWGRALAPLDGIFRRVEPHYPAMKRWRIIGALPTYLPRWRLPLLECSNLLRRAMAFDGLVMTDALRRRLYRAPPPEDAAFAAVIQQSLASDPARLAQRLVINTWLAGNALLNADKVTMAHSLEARVPFFDPALLDWAAGIPAELQLRSNKHVLREAMRPLLPDWALERPKQPFGTPILAWFGGALAARIQAVLRDPSALVREWFDGGGLDRLLDGHFSGRAPQVEIVFRLLTLELWGQRFLRRDHG